MDSLYHKYDEMVSFIQEQATKCASIIKLSTVGTSLRGKQIISLEMTENPGVPKLDKPRVGLVGSLQGTDVIGKELLLKVIAHLCNGYKEKEEKIVRLLETTSLHIIPSANVDGNEKAHEGDCEGELQPVEDLSRSFYYNLTLNQKQSLPQNIEQVTKKCIVQLTGSFATMKFLSSTLPVETCSGLDCKADYSLAKSIL